MTIEEIRYDFTEYAEHFRNFFSKTLRLIIISKLNCQETNKTSAKYLNEIVNNIEGCKTHKVRYGKPMIFTKFLQYEFTYQTIKVTIKITDKYIVDILLESIIPDFVRFFDELSSDTKTIKWNTGSSTHNNNNNNTLQENTTLKHETSTTDSTSKEQKGSELGGKEWLTIQSEIKTIFCLLELFIETLYYLTTISPNGNSDSLIGKAIVIKDVSVIRKNVNIEILVDEKMVIISLAPKKNNLVSVVLDTEDMIGNTIKQIILQNKNF
ncbi:MAG TPA: hypothetical protein VER14_04990 [Phototrophicaceae bacterium]|nr:hypothetical protein [Phototrophicaceae bacterium]